jgi:hypothetical protein
MLEHGQEAEADRSCANDSDLVTGGRAYKIESVEGNTQRITSQQDTKVKRNVVRQWHTGVSRHSDVLCVCAEHKSLLPAKAPITSAAVGTFSASGDDVYGYPISNTWTASGSAFDNGSG